MASGADSQTFLGDFERLRPRLAGASAGWLGDLRRDGIEAFRTGGFPSVRDEDWKYTSILPALRERLEPVLASDAQAADAEVAPILSAATGVGPASPSLVFVDGVFRASLSSAAGARGLRLSSLRERLESDASTLEPWLGRYLPPSVHGFAALNTAFLDDGAVVEIAEGTVVEEPVHLVFVSTKRPSPFVTHPRNVLVAGAGSSALVVEHYLGDPAAVYLTNTATEAVVGRSAALGHLRVQDEARGGFHVARVQVEQEAGSAFLSHAIAFGAALSRTEISIRLGGEEAECQLHGLYAMDGSRHADHHLSIDHAARCTRSDQLYKGVLDDRSRGVFTGKVLVRSGSQKIKAMQKNPSLLLGRGAVAESRPQLEIYADDVACNHGATIGRLDEDALFYLLSRGIEPREARRLMVAGFAAEVVETVASEPLREALSKLVHERIGELGAPAAVTQQAAGVPAAVTQQAAGAPAAVTKEAAS